MGDGLGLRWREARYVMLMLSSKKSSSAGGYMYFLDGVIE